MTRSWYLPTNSTKVSQQPHGGDGSSQCPLPDTRCFVPVCGIYDAVIGILSPKVCPPRGAMASTHSGVTVHFIVPASSINPRLSSTQLHLQFHFDLTSDIFHPGSSFQIVMMKFFKMAKLSRNHLKGKVPPVSRRVTPFRLIWLSPIT